MKGPFPVGDTFCQDAGVPVNSIGKLHYRYEEESNRF